MSQRLEAFTLFSSSKGNSALFRYGQECVLIDAGVSARALNASLQALGTSLYEIRAIFVTHEHSDHIKGLETISKAFSIPIYAPSAAAPFAPNARARRVCCVRWTVRSSLVRF